MSKAPYHYHGNKDTDAAIYEELKHADYDTYIAIRTKYRKDFMNSRPYKSTVTARGTDKFPNEWGRTLKNLKAMFNYTPPIKRNAWGDLLRSEGM